ncbi:MAG: substrate-binding domain-containing protein [Calditrichia bacterium]
MTWIKILLIFLLSIFSTICCQRGEKSNVEGQTVALVMKTLNNPFFIDMQNGAEEQAQKSGLSLTIQAAEREVDVEKQMQIIENMIQTRVDVICVTPSGSKEIIPAIVKANLANIPVIIVDTRVDSLSLAEAGGKIATFIGSDNFEGGRIAGKYIAKRLNGRGKMAVLEGIPGHETGDARLSGLRKSVDANSGIEIVTSQTANWERNQGFNVFQNIMQSYPGIQALFACNDMMALGAVEAITAAGKTGQIIVVGFDAIEDAREAIRTGKMDGSIAQHPYDMGRLAIENAKKIIDGKTIPSYIPVKIDLITKENLERSTD